jgi:hypothetical protein
MSTSPARNWSLNALIDDYEARGLITPLLTPDERGLAQAVADAFYFAHLFTELPGRCPEDSPEFLALEAGASS